MGGGRPQPRKRQMRQPARYCRGKSLQMRFLLGIEAVHVAGKQAIELVSGDMLERVAQLGKLFADSAGSELIAQVAEPFVDGSAHRRKPYEMCDALFLCRLDQLIHAHTRDSP